MGSKGTANYISKEWSCNLPLAISFKNGQLTEGKHFFLLPDAPTKPADSAPEVDKVKFELLSILHKRVKALFLGKDLNSAASLKKRQTLLKLYNQLTPNIKNYSLHDVSEKLNEWALEYKEIIETFRAPNKLSTGRKTSTAKMVRALKKMIGEAIQNQTKNLKVRTPHATSKNGKPTSNIKLFDHSSTSSQSNATPLNEVANSTVEIDCKI